MFRAEFHSLGTCLNLRRWQSTSICLAVAALLMLISVQPVFAQAGGDLVVSPTRVVLEGRDRTATLSLVNTGSETSTFRISVINMRMGPTGQLTEIAQPDPGQLTAERLFRYSPRQVVLEPGASQAIRVLLRKPNDLPDGEYRSHIMMRAVPNVQNQSVEPDVAGAATVRVIPVFGIAIPIIVRHGSLDYGVNMENLELLSPDENNPLPRAKFDLVRNGNRSAFGDLTVSVPGGGGEDVILGRIMRLAVYTPNDRRSVEINLRVPEGVTLSGKPMKVTYTTIADEGGELLGEQTINLP